jgi:hypothetical protein
MPDTTVTNTKNPNAYNGEVLTVSDGPNKYGKKKMYIGTSYTT